MKKIFTLFQLFAVSTIILLLLPSNDAKAQLIDEAVCSYEDNCIFVEYTSIQEESPTSATLLVVLTAFLDTGGPCTNLDGMFFQPIGGLIVFRSRAELLINPNIELTVNRALFTATPDVIVGTYRATPIFPPPFDFPIIVPTQIVDLQARLDTDDPCEEIVPLPVELVSFKGKASQGAIILEWRTASEENNSHFEVERSADGNAFEQVGKVSGHGNSSTVIDYRHQDTRPLPGLNYYRLKQVDYDGQYEYSKVIAVRASEGNGMPLQVALAPNPCRSGDCNISIYSKTPQQQVHVQLLDPMGRVVFEQNLKDAYEELDLPQELLQNLRGVYILSAKSGQETVRQRVVLE